MFQVFALGNPGEKYQYNRHNAGRLVLAAIKEFPKKIKIIMPDDTVFMNDSGKTVGKAVKTAKDAEKFILIHDDLDLPLGGLKISFNRGTGGHNGVASVIKKLKTEKFWRIRIGVAPTTPSGKIKKLLPDKKGVPFLLGDFKDKELLEIKKISKKVAEILQLFAEKGGAAAMNAFN